MPGSSTQEVSQILKDWSDGDRDAPARLMPLVYDELRILARKYLDRERVDHTLQATALVHEAYLRLVDQSRVNWQSRAQFYGVAAQLMRRILVDHARAHHASKRGGVVPKLSLDEAKFSPQEKPQDLIALDEALSSLTQIDERKGKVVELKFFGGLTFDEMAEVLEVSKKTVRRDWDFAKLWLYRELSNEGKDAD